MSVITTYKELLTIKKEADEKIFKILEIVDKKDWIICLHTHPMISIYQNPKFPDVLYKEIDDILIFVEKNILDTNKDDVNKIIEMLRGEK